VLYLYQQGAHASRHVFAQQHANVAIELVHIAHGVHTQAVFRNPGVVAQPCGAVVTRAGGYLCESFAHGVAP
jgi:hypothetical protein